MTKYGEIVCVRCEKDLKVKIRIPIKSKALAKFLSLHNHTLEINVYGKTYTLKNPEGCDY